MCDFVVGKVALGQVFCFFRVLPFSIVSIIPQMLHTRLHVAVTRTNRPTLGTFQKVNALSEIGEHWIEKYFHIIFKRLQRCSCNVKMELSLRSRMG